MPKFSIEQPHALEPSTVKERLNTLSARLADKYGIHSKWKSDTHATFERTGASGTIQVSPGKVLIHVDLSFALTPMRGKVEGRIREELKKALAPAAEPASAPPEATPAEGDGGEKDDGFGD